MLVTRPFSEMLGTILRLQVWVALCTHTHATADKFGGQCVNSCWGRSGNIWASDMWVKLFSPAPLLLPLSSSFFGICCFLKIFKWIVMKIYVNIWSFHVRRWGGVYSELSDSWKAWPVAWSNLLSCSFSHASISSSSYISYLVWQCVPFIQSKHRTWSVCLFCAAKICSRLWGVMKWDIWY